MSERSERSEKRKKKYTEIVEDQRELLEIKRNSDFINSTRLFSKKIAMCKSKPAPASSSPSSSSVNGQSRRKKTIQEICDDGERETEASLAEFRWFLKKQGFEMCEGGICRIGKRGFDEKKSNDLSTTVTTTNDNVEFDQESKRRKRKERRSNDGDYDYTIYHNNDHGEE
jgi:hypothetical protein